MSYLNFDGLIVHPTCKDCDHLYCKSWHTNKGGTRYFYKCDFKPRGTGYDVRLSHPACSNFKKKKN